LGPGESFHRSGQRPADARAAVSSAHRGYRAGSPVRLDELGQVFDSVEDDKTAGWYRDERAVVLAIQRQPGTNTVEVVDNIKALIPSFRR